MCSRMCCVRVINFLGGLYCASISLSHKHIFYKYNYKGIKICTYIERKKQKKNFLPNCDLFYRMQF